MYYQMSVYQLQLCKIQVNRLRNKKVTIYHSVLSYKQEGASWRHFDFMLVEVMKLDIFQGNSSPVLC